MERNESDGSDNLVKIGFISLYFTGSLLSGQQEIAQWGNPWPGRFPKA
jgi:hypothetical protein